VQDRTRFSLIQQHQVLAKAVAVCEIDNSSYVIVSKMGSREDLILSFKEPKYQTNSDPRHVHSKPDNSETKQK
jgi:hypothetical protein